MQRPTPDYKHDIFISYAHVDNEPFIGFKHGWVTYLFQTLTYSLAKKFGAINVTSRWKGVQSMGNVLVQSEIAQNLERSAILLILLSPGFLSSELCMQELRHFLNTIKTERNNGYQRIFIVEKNKIEENAFPKSLSKFPLDRFWNLDAQGRARTLAIPRPDPMDIRYHQKVDDLARKLIDTLTKIRMVNSPKKALTRSTQPLKIPIETVFLADVSEDLIDEHDSIKRYLEQANIRVCPGKRVSYYFMQKDLSEFDEYMGNSKLFVQLLSKQALRDESGVNLTRLQFSLAISKGVPIVQWRHPDLDISSTKDPDQKEMLDLKSVKAMNFAEFKKSISHRLLKKPKVPSAQRQFVFLNANNVDERLAEKIGKIIKQLGIDWRSRLNDGASAIVRKDLTDGLKKCDALIVIYGEINVNWVQSQFSYYRKVRGARPLMAFGLYEGPPEDKPDVGRLMPGMQVLNCRKGIDEVKLRGFLSPLLNAHNV